MEGELFKALDELKTLKSFVFTNLIMPETNFSALDNFVRKIPETEKDVYKIKQYVSDLYGKSLGHVNSTARGGGVNEILDSEVPLENYFGSEGKPILFCKRHVINGEEWFFEITKKVHNALHGLDVEFTKKDLIKYKAGSECFSLDFRESLDKKLDSVTIHDLQPASLISRRYGYPDLAEKWALNFHTDISNVNENIWNLFLPIINEYDAIVVSSEKYKRKDISVPQYVINPAINPLSDKNKEMPQEKVRSILEKFHIDPKKPIISQVSRFDKLKGYDDVIKIYESLKEKHKDLQLVLVGSTSVDDPEGKEEYKKIRSLIESSPNKQDMYIYTNLDGVWNEEVNAIQRASSIALQMSIAEGFALTISEALYKGVPVVARNVGGLPLQVNSGINGYLVDIWEEAVEKVDRLLSDVEERGRLGSKGIETTKNKFLITRLVKDRLKLFLDMQK